MRDRSADALAGSSGPYGRPGPLRRAVSSHVVDAGFSTGARRGRITDDGEIRQAPLATHQAEVRHVE